jgi:hypothetical protein
LRRSGHGGDDLGCDETQLAGSFHI